MAYLKASCRLWSDEGDLSLAAALLPGLPLLGALAGASAEVFLDRDVAAHRIQ